ncbi:NnrS family protein [Celeribacter indicus]|uniref:Protein NnrS n=1 Tax=Celeribacter indicus TaxID=1208324 RepID=A0A0B5DY27_9RHOB|nr:NnrS family protein [Celeribacter indicus]AJE45626.1 protein NnrS [Celeribacter indicus]SDW84257.1 uncharacterized protein involved in response to NO [Celeribacter indicus]
MPALTSAERMRRWQGPAILSFGFRPFFLFGALWAGVAMLLWIPALSGALDLPSRLDPVSWHAHAFLFGYLGAVVAGFLLTAVPNWTGRLPVTGGALAALFALWAAGRFGILFSGLVPFGTVVALDLAFPLVLGALILREIAAGKNWHNLPVLGLLATFALADLLFLLEAARGGVPADGAGMRLGLAAVLMMIAMIGGRIIPSFTRNWLAKTQDPARPAPPMQRFDKAVLLSTLPALALWVVRSDAPLTALALIAIGVLHLLRLARWKGPHTRSEPLLAVLHVAYLFLPLGAFAVAAAILAPAVIQPTAALHLWTAGAAGGMTLAVMTRASLGHTGRPLTASRMTSAIYLAILLATLLRVAAGIVPLMLLTHLSGGFWCLAFLGFAASYGPMLCTPRRARAERA